MASVPLFPNLLHTHVHYFKQLAFPNGGTRWPPKTREEENKGRGRGAGGGSQEGVAEGEGGFLPFFFPLFHSSNGGVSHCQIAKKKVRLCFFFFFPLFLPIFFGKSKTKKKIFNSSLSLSIHIVNSSVIFMGFSLFSTFFFALFFPLRCGRIFPPFLKKICSCLCLSFFFCSIFTQLLHHSSHPRRRGLEKNCL